MQLRDKKGIENIFLKILNPKKDRKIRKKEQRTEGTKRKQLKI